MNSNTIIPTPHKTSKKDNELHFDNQSSKIIFDNLKQ